MKNTVRIIGIASILSFAGLLATSWGAESVSALISQGEELVGKVRSSQDALDAAVKFNKDLASQGKQIMAEQQQLKADIDAYKKQNDDIKQQSADYKAKCDGKQLNQSQFADCKAQLAQINTAIDNVNAQPAKLNKRQNDFLAQANKYNEEVKTAPKKVTTADDAFRGALADEYSWLDKARTLILSPAFQPYAKKAACPDVKNPAKSVEENLKISDEIIACLKKVAGAN
jgi:chromosome segregation ATPase